MVDKKQIEELLEEVNEMLDIFPFIKMSENEELWKIRNWYLIKLKNRLMEML